MSEQLFTALWLITGFLSMVAGIWGLLISDNLKNWIAGVYHMPNSTQSKHRQQQLFQIELCNSIAVTGFSLLLTPVVASLIWSKGNSLFLAIGAPVVIVLFIVVYRFRRVRYEWKAWKTMA